MATGAPAAPAGEQHDESEVHHITPIHVDEKDLEPGIDMLEYTPDFQNRVEHLAVGIRNTAEIGLEPITVPEAEQADFLRFGKQAPWAMIKMLLNVADRNEIQRYLEFSYTTGHKYETRFDQMNTDIHAFLDGRLPYHDLKSEAATIIGKFLEYGLVWERRVANDSGDIKALKEHLLGVVQEQLEKAPTPQPWTREQIAYAFRNVPIMEPEDSDED